MIIKQTNDMELVREIMTIPDIWEVISDDGCDMDAWEPSPDWMYIKGTLEGELVGLFAIHLSDIGVHQCHVQVVPAMRKIYAVEFGKITLDWVWNNTGIKKMFALIPDIYPNVKKFSEIQGFHQEGLVTKSHIKNGNLCSQWLMTIERGD